MQVVIASGPVIIENNKILLDKHGSDDFWKFPGGRLNHGETLEECAIMRVKEELGIDVKLIKPLKPMITYQGEDAIILIHFLAKRRGEIKPAKNVREWKWFDVKKLPKDTGPNIRPVLKELKPA